MRANYLVSERGKGGLHAYNTVSERGRMVHILTTESYGTLVTVYSTLYTQFENQ